MFLKILATVVLVVVAWTVATRLTGPGRRRRPPKRDERPVPTQKLVKCADCGIYLPAGEPCDCTPRA